MRYYITLSIIALFCLIFGLSMGYWQATKWLSPPPSTPLVATPTPIDTGKQDEMLVAHQITTLALTKLDLEYDKALLLAAEASRMADTPTTRGSLLYALRYLPELSTIIPNSRWAEGLAFSPDGNFLAAAFGAGRIVVYDVATSEPIDQTFTGLGTGSDAGTYPSSIAFSPDGKWLAGTNPYFSTQMPSTQIVIWEFATGEIVAEASIGVRNILFTPDGQHLLTTSPTEIIYWQIAEKQLVERSRLEIETTQRSNPQIAVHPNKNEPTIIIGLPLQKVLVWNPLTNAQEELPIENYRERLALNHDGSLLVLETSTGIMFWQVEEQQIWYTIPSNNINQVIHFSSDGTKLLTASPHREIFQLWDIGSSYVATHGQPVHRWGNTAGPLAIALHPNGQTVAASYEQSSIIMWDSTGVAHLGRQVAPESQLLQEGNSSVWGARKFQFVDETTLGAYYVGNVGQNDELLFWDVATGETVATYQSFESLEAKHYLFNHDFSLAALAGYGDNHNTILLGNPQTGEFTGTPLVMENRISQLAFDPQGYLLAATNEESQVITIWDVSTQQVIKTLPIAENERVLRLVFSPNGQILAVTILTIDTYYIYQVSLWDTASYELLLPPFSAGGEALLFSADSHILMTHDFGRASLKLWDIATGEQRRPMDSAVFGEQVNFAFSSKSPYIAVENLGYVNYGERFRSISLIDTHTYQEIAGGRPFLGSTPIFSPQGRFLAMMGNSDDMTIWDMSLTSWQEAACRKANRNLTEMEWQLYFQDIPYRKTCPNLP